MHLTIECVTELVMFQSHRRTRGWPRTSESSDKETHASAIYIPVNREQY